MTSACLTALVLVVAVSVVADKKSAQDRNLVQLAAQMFCTTGRIPLVYNKYGCWCGFRGGPGEPKDDIDKCCRGHDLCYLAASKNVSQCGKFPLQVHYIGYDPECNDHVAGCAPKQSSACASTICHCDEDFANCLRGKDLNPEFESYDNNSENCREQPTETLL